MATTGKIPSAIKGIKLNRATFADEPVEQLTYVNFFYGNNGAGKSSIARAIDENDGVEWSEGNSRNDFDVPVYNQEFIKRHFASYDNVQGVYIVNETNTKAYRDIEIKKQERKALETEFDKAKIGLKGRKEVCETLTKNHRDSLFQKVIETRTEFDVALDGKKRRDGFVNALLSATPKDHKIEELRMMLAAFDDTTHPYPLFNKVSFPNLSANMPGWDLINTPIVSSSNTVFAQFIRSVGSIDWIKQGYEHYQKANLKKCPYCQQILPDKFEEDIRSAFDEQYQRDYENYRDFVFNYIDDITDVLSVLKKNLATAMPSLQTVEYAEKLALLEQTFKNNHNKLDDKGIYPSKCITLEDTDSILAEINGMIDKFNQIIRQYNDAITTRKDTKAKCKRYIMEYFAFVLADDIKNFNTKYEVAQKEQTVADKKVSDIQAQINGIDKEIADLNSQIVNIESTVECINKLLRESGFQGFYLRTKINTPGTYEVIRENHENDGAAKNLSEGERNFIAFLYFYHLVRGSFDSNNIKDKIVVIDDPVSSMDSHALFIVSAIVREMINVCRNNTEYLNPKVPGDYIRQIFILTHNVYFHREITYQQVQYYKCASFYIIRKHDNVSTVKLCVRKSQHYTGDMENFNPVQHSYAALWEELKEAQSAIPAKNIIRQILEYYFLQLCGYEGSNIRERVLEEHKAKFIDTIDGQKPDMTKYEIASSMLAYINNPNGISDGLNYVDETDDVTIYKNVFHTIFEALEQEQHYDMMMGIISKKRR